MPREIELSDVTAVVEKVYGPTILQFEMSVAFSIEHWLRASKDYDLALDTPLSEALRAVGADLNNLQHRETFELYVALLKT